MKVKQPMVTVSTTDITKPNMSVSTTSEWTNVSRPFTFSVSDAESGISKIQVSTDGTNWTNIFEFSSYETSAERYYEIEENANKEIIDIEPENAETASIEDNSVSETADKPGF